MANSGNTTTAALSDSLNMMVAAARIVREFEGVVPQLVDKQTLDEGTGLTWNEVSLAALTAQAVSENTELDNPQQVSDTNFPITPTMVGIHIVVTDRVKRRLAAKAYAKIGSLAQNALQRKKAEDGIIVFDGGTSLSGTTTTLVSGVIAAAAVRITSNATEPGKPPIRCVLHGFQIKDLYDELVAGIGTNPLPEGRSARVFQDGFRGKIAGAEVYEDGNITIDSTGDAKGGVFAQEGIVLVQGKSPWKATEREEGLGGGADSVYLYDEYAYGERLPGGSTSGWLYEIYSDATSPTS